MRFEVQQNTPDGWVNTWLCDAGDGVKRPETFARPFEALEALHQYLDLIKVLYGERYTPSVREYFRVRPVTEAKPAP